MEFNLADLMECVADAVPDRAALVAGDRRLTFRELDERATRLAHHLQAQGIGKDDHVGLYLYNGTEYLEASLALHKIRAVPININWRYVDDEIRYLFGDSDLVGVIYSREFGERLARVARQHAARVDPRERDAQRTNDVCRARPGEPAGRP